MIIGITVAIAIPVVSGVSHPFIDKFAVSFYSILIAAIAALVVGQLVRYLRSVWNQL